MSESYNSVPPPPGLASGGSETGGINSDANFLDAIAKARAIAAKVKEQHNDTTSKPLELNEDPQSRKRNLSEDRDSAPYQSSEYRDPEREAKRPYSGQDYQNGPPRYGLGSEEQVNRASTLNSVYGPGSGYNTANSSEEFTVPNNLVGLIIGRSGETLKRIQNLSGARVNFAQDQDPNELERRTTVSGGPEAIKTAREMIDQLIQNHQNTRNGGFTSQRSAYTDLGRAEGIPEGSKDLQLPVPGNRVGLIIGRGGETIRDLIEQSGARINVVPDNSIPHGANVERLINIQGTQDCIDRAKSLILAIVSGEINTSRGSLAYQNESSAPRYGQEKVVIQVPNDKVGLLIGRGGETIKFMQQQSRARITIEVPDTEPAPPQRNITLSGPHDAVEYARSLILEKVDGVSNFSRYDGPPGFGDYSMATGAQPAQPYGSYPYYAMGGASNYAYPPTNSGAIGESKPQDGNSDSSALPSTSGPQDPSSAVPAGVNQEAYAAYYKQLQDYYAAYYASVGYSYPTTTDSSYSAPEQQPSSKPEDATTRS